MIDDWFTSFHVDQTHDQGSDEFRRNRQSQWRHDAAVERQAVHCVERRRCELRHKRLPNDHCERVANNCSDDVEGNTKDDLLDAAVEEDERYDVRQRVGSSPTAANDVAVCQADEEHGA